MRALLLTLLRWSPARASLTTTTVAWQFVAHGFTDVDASMAGKARHHPVVAARASAK